MCRSFNQSADVLMSWITIVTLMIADMLLAWLRLFVRHDWLSRAPAPMSRIKRYCKDGRMICLSVTLISPIDCNAASSLVTLQNTSTVPNLIYCIWHMQDICAMLIHLEHTNCYDILILLFSICLKNNCIIEIFKKIKRVMIVSFIL